LFRLLGAFHRKKLGQRNKQVGFAFGFGRSTSFSRRVEKAPTGGASRGFALNSESFSTTGHIVWTLLQLNATAGRNIFPFPYFHSIDRTRLDRRHSRSPSSTPAGVQLVPARGKFPLPYSFSPRQFGRLLRPCPTPLFQIDGIPDFAAACQPDPSPAAKLILSL
jgi:hypothetical protein